MAIVAERIGVVGNARSSVVRPSVYAVGLVGVLGQHVSHSSSNG